MNLIKTIVKVVAPEIGNTIYDGAVGSAGFLCEAFEYLKHSKTLTTTDVVTLQKKTFYGKEKKSLAYIIGTMNTILHGVEAPNIVHTNTLAENLADIQEKDRYDVVLGFFMLLWFGSGLVIMYSPTITQTRSQQLAHAETLSPELGWLSLGEAWARSAQQRLAALPAKGNNATVAEGAGKRANETEVSIVDARLVRSAGEPLWLIEDTKGQRYALSARDGSLQNITAEHALTIARHWFEVVNKGAEFTQGRVLASIDKTILLRNQEALSPFHKIGMGSEGDELLISSKTGEVLHASNSQERTFYWAGNWLHLMKPLDALGLGALRNDVQLWFALAATLATLTGLIIGWLRWRPGLGGNATYSEGRTQPYREFWFKWHFWSGLVGGTVIFMWALSGFFDTNPGKLFSPVNPNRQEINRYLGNGLPLAMSQWQPDLPLEQAVAVEGSEVVELSWKHLGDVVVLLAYTRDGQRLSQKVKGTAAQFNDTALLAAVARLAPNTKIASQQRVEDYDSYYYPRQDQTRVEKPLPVVLVELADAAKTRLYIDPQEGKLLAKMDRSARVLRWIYSAVHHWDFAWFTVRPLWDIWMLMWLVFGLVLGTSSVVIGWRRLKLSIAPLKKVPRRPRSALL